MSYSQREYNAEGVRICPHCKKPEGEIKFTKTKNKCNNCRALDVSEDLNSPENQAVIWKERNKVKAKIFLKNKVDPCFKCLYDKCQFCVAYHLKKNYFHPKDEASKAFVAEFNKNLLENIRKIVEGS